MCYDISFSTKIELVTDYLPELEMDPQIKLSFEPIIHIQAQAYQQFPVLISDEGKYKLKKFEWGIIAPYMDTKEKIKKLRPQMCNARSEKLLDKTSYWYKIRTARCLIPVTGIFEHREIKGWKNKVPYHVQLKNRDVFALPGLYHYPNRADAETGEVTGTFTIITRSANDLMKQIHNSGEQAFRMPLFLTKELEIKWLSPTLTDTDLAEILDFEMPSSSLSYIPVYTIRTTRERPDQQIKTAEYLWEGLPPLGVDSNTLSLF
jgi:putative SOS response-associated peptidase YedK